MKTATQIKLDREVKTKAHQLAGELGLSLSTLINAQLKQFIRDKQLVLSQTPVMSTYLEELLGPIERDIKHGRNISKPIRSSADLDAYFHSL